MRRYVVFVAVFVEARVQIATIGCFRPRAGHVFFEGILNIRTCLIERKEKDKGCSVESEHGVSGEPMQSAGCSAVASLELLERKEKIEVNIVVVAKRQNRCKVRKPSRVRVA